MIGRKKETKERKNYCFIDYTNSLRGDFLKGNINFSIIEIIFMSISQMFITSVTMELFEGSVPSCRRCIPQDQVFQYSKEKEMLYSLRVQGIG